MPTLVNHGDICAVQTKVKRSSGKRKQAAAEGPRGPPPKEIDANGEEVYYVRPR